LKERSSLFGSVTAAVSGDFGERKVKLLRKQCKNAVIASSIVHLVFKKTANRAVFSPFIHLGVIICAMLPRRTGTP
jgi:hypothetical protein